MNIQKNPEFDVANYSNDSLNIRQEVEKYIYHWKWFVLSVVLCLAVTFTYLRYTNSHYEVISTILVNDEETGGLTSELSAFEDLGLIGNRKTTIDNEIELLKSRSLLERVIKELKINVTFFRPGRVIKTEFFTKENPLNINFLVADSILYTLNKSFSIKIISKTNFTLNEGLGEQNYEFGKKIITSFGPLIVTPNSLEKILPNDEFFINVLPLRAVVEKYNHKIHVTSANNSSSVIKLSLRDPVRSKAQAVINSLISQYNKDAVEDKSLIAKNTNRFIVQRLALIDKDLESVEQGAEAFKSLNNLTDISAESNLFITTKSEIEKRILDLNTRLKLVVHVISFMNTNENDLIPANLGLKDIEFSENSIKYNELLLEKKRLLEVSSNENPVVKNLNNQLVDLKKSVFQSLKNLESSLSISLNEVAVQEQKIDSKIRAVPRQEREYRDILRQQQIIESLYLYLLQKREENAITLAVTLPNAKIIDAAYGSAIPVSPNKKIFYLVALLVGVLLPFCIIYMFYLLDNKVHSRQDIEKIIHAPILGEIPKSDSKSNFIVTNNSRSSASESFRLLRTNINFMLSNKTQEAGRSIFLTSTLSGEGKTYAAINLALVMALSNKRVLLIGGDIRQPKIATYLNVPKVDGLTHFLMDHSLAPTDVIQPFENGNIDIIQSGIIPPNPSELLMNGRFDELLNYGQKNYDFVIVDTAPINSVTDTLLLGDKADLFIYLIRANFLDKRLLEIPKSLVEQNRLPNIALLLNDVNFEKGYGYGYGYGEVQSKKWWRL